MTDTVGNNDEKLTRLVTNGTSVDLIFATNGWFEKQLFQYGFAYDMTDLIKTTKLDMTQFNPSYSEMFSKGFGGRMYYLPVQADIPTIYYNKALFDKFAIPYPKDGMSWDDMYATSKKLNRNEGGVAYSGYIPSMTYTFAGNPMSIPYLKPGTTTPTINTDERWKTFFQKYLADAAASADPGYFKGKNDITEFFAGRSAMATLVTANMTSSRAQLEPMNFDVTTFPTLKESPKTGPQALSVNMAVSKTSKHKEEAMEVLKYIVSDEVQSGLAKIGIVPVVKNVDIQKLLGTGSVFKDKNWSSVFFNQWANNTYYGAMLIDLRAIYIKYGNEVLFGTSDINTALRKAEEEALKKVEEVKGLIVVSNVY
jgi:multiple sugar transport system substrate-binding protein